MPEEFERESTSIASFEDQFNRQETLNFLGGLLKVVDAIPEKRKTEPPVFICPGWGEDQETFKDSLRTLFDAGRHVISLRHVERQVPLEFREREQEYSIAELRKARAIEAVLDSKQIGRVDIVAHSEGAINAAIFSILHPEKVRNLVLVNPASLIGKDSFSRLAGRYLVNIIRGIHEALADPEGREALERSGIATWRYVTSNIVGAAESASAIAGSQIQDILKKLHEAGIGIAVVHGVDDPVFSMQRMQSILRSEYIDGFYSVKGGHNDIYVHPNKYMMLVDQALDAFDKRPLS